LDLKHHVLSAQAVTSDGGFYLGQGQKSTRQSLAPDDAMIQSVIGPALQEAVEAGSWRVQSDAMMAIAKLYPVFEPKDTSLLELISAHLNAANQKQAESAIVALGILGHPRAAQVLMGIAQDSDAGRKSLGRTSVPSRTRSLAALSLGVLGRQLESEYPRLLLVAGLQGLLKEPRGASPDLHVAALTALGMTGLREAGDTDIEGDEQPADALTSRGDQARFLFSILRDEERHQYVRAHVSRALALLGQGASEELRDSILQALLHELERRGRSQRLVSYGVVEALGMLADSDPDGIDAEVRKALHESALKGNNNQRGISLVALALVSSRAGQGAEPLGALRKERKYLLQQLATGKSRLRPWAALSLGLQQFHAARAGADGSSPALKALLNSNEKVRSAGDSGAWSIALGLMGDPSAEGALLNRMEKSGDDNARGHAAVGLGLLRSHQSAEALQAVVEDSRFRPIPLRKAAVALVLLGDKRIVTQLFTIISEEKTASVKTNCIAALGLVGDRRAVEPLVALLQDPEQLDMTRSFASIALGVTCETDPLPWTAHISNHVNYFAMIDSILSSGGTGVLNLR
jgi:HEAT repeat protein